MERDPYEGGTDVGRDDVRDLGDEPPAAIRDAAPDDPGTDRRLVAGQRPHPAAPNLPVAGRFARARLGPRP